MPYLNTHRTAELCFLPCMINVIAASCMAGDSKQEAFELSKNAMLEMTAGASKKQCRTIDNHHNTMLKYTIATMQSGIAGEKIVLAVYCFIELLCEHELIIIGDESAVAVLMNWLLTSIDADSDVTQKRLKNAQKDAARWLDALQKAGYYESLL